MKLLLYYSYTHIMLALFPVKVIVLKARRG